MTDHQNKMALRPYALIAGLTILVMAIIAPIAEIYAYPKLVIPGNAAQTVKNITANKTVFIGTIFCYFLTFVGDIVVAWALYVLLKPVNRHLSLLAAWFRLVFAIITLMALLNLVTVFRLLHTPDYVTVFEPAQLGAQVMFCLNTFRSSYHFGLLFVSIHLVLLGYLVFISGYIPKIMGILLVICGVGYLTDTLQPFLFPNFHSGYITITFFGELIFMLWLLIKGSRIGKLSEEA